MVGAQAFHELVVVSRSVLLGLRARVIGRGDRHRVSRSAAILSILFSPLHGGALVLILVLGLTFAMASIEAWWERRLLEVLGKGSWPWAVRARTPVDAACVSVWPELRVGRRLVRSGRQVKTRCRCGLMCRAQRLLR